MLINDTRQYQRAPFSNEAEIEEVVRKYADQLFGANIIYLSQARIATLGGAGTVPDAIVVDVEGEEWYLVEAERAVHGTWEHIAPQVSKQLAALASPATRQALLESALNQVAQEPSLPQMLSDLGLTQLEVHGHLQRILNKPATIAIPIDAIPKDLKDWIQTLRNTTKIWVIEKYISVNGTPDTLYSLPDENLPTLMTSTSAAEGISRVTTRSSQPYQDLIDSGLLQEGQELVMEYGPRGRPRQKYRAVARAEGLEVDGRIFSPSYAAVYCMNKAGSSRRTANGWVSWKTPAGEFLDDLYKRVAGAQDHVPSGLPESALPEGTVTPSSVGASTAGGGLS